jgi:hypothetical protein
MMLYKAGKSNFKLKYLIVKYLTSIYANKVKLRHKRNNQSD